MAIDPITAGLGAASLFSSKSANKRAEKQQKSALDIQKQAAKRAQQLWDYVEEYRARGQFDPEKQIKQLESDYFRQEKTDLGNIGGAFNAAGYLPGASEVGRTLTSFKTRNQQSLDRMRVDLRRQSFFDLLGGYQAAGNLGIAGANVAGNLAGQYGGMQQNPGNFFASIMPFLAKDSGGGGSAATMSSLYPTFGGRGGKPPGF